MEMEGSCNSINSELDSFVISGPSTSYILPDNVLNISENSSQNEDSLSADVIPKEELCAFQSETECDDYECDSDEFYFETDHPALKANPDYRKLLHTVLVLIAQRAQAIQDLDKLYEIQDVALADPIGFVKKLQRGDDLGIPTPQKIPEIPVIDWSKYSLTNVESTVPKRQLTRQSTKSVGDVLGLLIKQEGSNSTKKKGRLDQTKSSKFNQPWTAEEQKRLEDLLIEYPPEEIETRRWEKIAKALGNRTTTQVASRVQKYFIKLMKAGMPIPGRQPNTCYLRKPRRQVIRQQPSTFLVSHTLPVFINEEDENYSSNDCSRPTSDSENSIDPNISDEDDVDLELRHTAEYQEIISIKKALKNKQQDIGVVHHGFKCAHCEFEPIIGVRWHCTECSPSQSVDFCEDCVNSNHEVKSHTSSHRLEPINQTSSAVLDRDYMLFAGNDFSYLDPNYMPAT